ncbi:hypothetical protein CSA08_01435 [Candidatus Gracilibacteria bacterium]|nr:MAG: hypothetical protein CSA08_01435 [Candidatus Gracilibacteria bacterium]
MFFKKKEKIKNHAKGFDKLITGLIIGGAVASVLGLSKTERGKKLSKATYKSSKGIFRKGYSLFGKLLVRVIRIFHKK